MDRPYPITTGAVYRRSRTPGFRLTEAYQHPRRVAEHAHARAHFSIAISGRYEEVVDGTRHLCSAGTVMVKPPGAPHANEYLEPTHSLIVEVRPGAFDLPGVAPFFERPRRLDGTVLTGLVTDLRREMTETDPFGRLIVEGLLLELLGAMGRLNRRGDDAESPLRPAVAYVRDHFRETVTLRDVAAAAQLSVPQLVRAFRAEMHCTVGEYVRRLRVDRALTELRRTDKPVAAIAVDLGFSDQSHFTRVFAQRVGVTPGRYRTEAAPRS